ncbi:hypothetical protein PROFUN_01395 [Planoprotostelium fungivorum]|uniref:Uncharacterized protein n=1 Tax=Planoprotostelium fungivorum TaxID=1890364 RepID=A0A2P6NT39_9EUKA|nr:hypothetical protein PROFUN_01395 [Planoprotostelium fungivorum]
MLSGKTTKIEKLALFLVGCEMEHRGVSSITSPPTTGTFLLRCMGIFEFLRRLKQLNSQFHFQPTEHISNPAR